MRKSKKKIVAKKTKLGKTCTDSPAFKKRVYSLRTSISRDGSVKPEVADVAEAVKKALGKACIYCWTELSVDNISADHRRSLKHGGTSDLGNINFEICQKCNAAKGSFDEDCFMDLIKVANKHGATKDLLARLKSANFQ